MTNPPRNGYDVRATDYAAMPGNRAFYRVWAERGVALIPAGTHLGLVVDLGCGSGFSTEVLLERCWAEQVIGLDPSTAMLRLARANPALDGARFVQARAEALPLPDASAGLVLSSFAFHWFRADAAARELHRILHPHGLAVCVIPVPVGASAAERGNRLVRRVLARQARASPLARRPTQGLQPERVVALFGACGLAVWHHDVVEWIEPFSSPAHLWATLDSRGSLEAIFGRGPVTAPAMLDGLTDNDLTDNDPVTFRWRVIRLGMRRG